MTSLIQRVLRGVLDGRIGNRNDYGRTKPAADRHLTGRTVRFHRESIPAARRLSDANSGISGTRAAHRARCCYRYDRLTPWAGPSDAPLKCAGVQPVKPIGI
jgi:hypothetical protein